MGWGPLLYGVIPDPIQVRMYEKMMHISYTVQIRVTKRCFFFCLVQFKSLVFTVRAHKYTVCGDCCGTWDPSLTLHAHTLPCMQVLDWMTIPARTEWRFASFLQNGDLQLIGSLIRPHLNAHICLPNCCESYSSSWRNEEESFCAACAEQEPFPANDLSQIKTMRSWNQNHPFLSISSRLLVDLVRYKMLVCSQAMQCYA